MCVESRKAGCRYKKAPVQGEGGSVTYIYGWKNNSKRKTLYSRECKVIKRLKMNSAAVIFENGQFEIISRNALRKRLP